MYDQDFNGLVSRYKNYLEMIQALVFCLSICFLLGCLAMESERRMIGRGAEDNIQEYFYVSMVKN